LQPAGQRLRSLGLWVWLWGCKVHDWGLKASLVVETDVCLVNIALVPGSAGALRTSAGGHTLQH